MPESYPQCTIGEKSLILSGFSDSKNSKTANVQSENFLKHIRIFEKCSRYVSQNQCDFTVSDKPQYEVDILLAIPAGKGVMADEKGLQNKFISA